MTVLLLPRAAPLCQFSDGVYLILLAGLLEGYFVPFHSYHPTPTTEAMRLHNVKLAFDLFQNAGVQEIPAQAEEIVEQDKKAILRVLYVIYSNYQVSDEAAAAGHHHPQQPPYEPDDSRPMDGLDELDETGLSPSQSDSHF